VAVQVHRHGRGRVSQNPLHNLRVSASTQPDRRRRVPQIVSYQGDEAGVVAGQAGTLAAGRTEFVGPSVDWVSSRNPVTLGWI
jgi:hypothetical protein